MERRGERREREREGGGEKNEPRVNRAARR
jgi:hypothetical protein